MSYDIQILNIPANVPPVSEIEYQIDSGSIIPIAAAVDDYPVGFLPPGTYANRIRGKNAIGVGPWSANKNKTIDWDDIFTYYSLGQGYVYDLSRMDTLWQDHLQTDPVTDYGQPVGYQLDLSGNGNHRSQSDVAKRPIYGRHPASGLRNLLIATATLATQSVAVTAAEHTLSFRGTGTVTLSGASTAGPLVGTGSGDIVSLTFTPSAGALTLTVSGTVEIAQLELGPTRTTYQAVGATLWDITEAGSPDCFFIAYDGINDFMRTINTVAPGATKEVTVVASQRRGPVAETVGTLVEHSSNSNLNNGSFSILAPPSVVESRYRFISRDTAARTATSGNFSMPDRSVVTGIGSTADSICQIRRNGSLEDGSNAATVPTDYTTQFMFFGIRNGTSFPYTGFEYFSFCAFKLLTTEVLDQIERLAGTKAGVSW